MGLVDPPRCDWDLPHPLECECRIVNIVSPFRPCHESKGVGTSLAHHAEEPQICVIPYERGTARTFLWSRERGMGKTGQGVRGRPDQNQMGD